MTNHTPRQPVPHYEHKDTAPIEDTARMAIPDSNASSEQPPAPGNYESMPYPPTRTKRRIPIMLWIFFASIILLLAGIICFTVAIERAGSLYDLAVRSGYQEAKPVSSTFETTDINRITIICPDGYRVTTKLTNSPDNQVHVTYMPNLHMQQLTAEKDYDLACTREGDQLSLGVWNADSQTYTGINAVFGRNHGSSLVNTSFIPQLYLLSEEFMNNNYGDDQPNLLVQIPSDYQGTLHINPENPDSSLSLSAHLITDYQGSAQIEIEKVALVEGKHLETTGDLTINRGMLFVGSLKGKQVKLQDNLSGLGLAHLSLDLLNSSYNELFYATEVPRDMSANIAAESLIISSAWPVAYDHVDAQQIDVTSKLGFVSLGLTGSEQEYTVHSATGYTKENLVVLGANRSGVEHNDDSFDHLAEQIASEVENSMSTLDSENDKSRPPHSSTPTYLDVKVTINTAKNNQRTISLAELREYGSLSRMNLIEAMRDNQLNNIDTTWTAGSYSGTMFAAYHAPLPTQETVQTSGNGPRSITIHAPYGHTDLTFNK